VGGAVGRASACPAAAGWECTVGAEGVATEICIVGKVKRISAPRDARTRMDTASREPPTGASSRPARRVVSWELVQGTPKRTGRTAAGSTPSLRKKRERHCASCSRRRQAGCLGVVCRVFTALLRESARGPSSSALGRDRNSV